MAVLLYRGIGHPWTAEPGWDQLMLSADSAEQLDTMVEDAKRKAWAVWFRSLTQGRCTAHMYKPSGATAPWEDVPWQGTPRGHGHQFRVGDEVYTDFASSLNQQRVTRHRITAIDYRKISQTGVVLRVTPRVPGSTYIDQDGTPVGDPWIDSAWFRRVELEA